MTRRPVTIRRFDPPPRLVINGRTLSASQAERFNALTAQVAEAPTLADRKLAKRVEQAGVRGLRELSEDLAADGFADQTNADTAETVARRRALGDEVGVVRDAAGVTMRVLTSDALGRARDGGHLDGGGYPAATLYRVGTLYRQCYEEVGAMLTPDRPEVRGSGSTGGVSDGVVAAGQTLGRMRSGQPPHTVKVLDSVCGLDLVATRAAVRLQCDKHTVERHLLKGLVLAAKNMGEK